jgi:hypothetical protein
MSFTLLARRTEKVFHSYKNTKLFIEFRAFLDLKSLNQVLLNEKKISKKSHEKSTGLCVEGQDTQLTLVSFRSSGLMRGVADLINWKEKE